MHHVGRILASGRTGRKWPVVLIEAGKSLNGYYYTPQLLRASVAQFERAPAKAFTLVGADGKPAGYDHLKADQLVEAALFNQVGWYEDVHFSESLNALAANLVLLPEGNEWADRLQRHLEALEAGGRLDSVGLSIDALGVMPGGSNVPVAFEHVHSIDVVSHPAAGGRIGHRIAASRSTPPERRTGPVKTVLDFLKAKMPRLCEGLSPSDGEKVIAKHIAKRIKEMGGDMGAADAAGLGSLILQDVAQLQNTDGAKLVAMLESAMEFVKKMLGIGGGDPEPTADPAPAKEPVKESVAPAAADPRVGELEKQLRESRVRESARVLKDACAARKLPQDSVARVLAAHKGRDDIDDARADEIAKGEQDYVDRIVAGAAPVRITAGREPLDNAKDVLAHMFAPGRIQAPKGGADNIGFSMHRFNEAFFGLDTRVTGMDARRKLRESIDATSFNQVYADALSRALLADYKANPLVADWRKVVRVVPLGDFRTHHVIKPGWYGFLPDVAAKSPYLTLTTPGDTEETIALSKRGGLESWSWEDQLNDDIGLIQTMISRLSRAAAETIYDHVFAIVRDATQPNLSDGLSLTSQSRTGDVNEGTLAMSADATGKTNYINTIKLMMQLKGGSGQAKNIRPKYCVIPFGKVEQFAYITKELSGGVTGTDVPDAVRRILAIALPEAIIDWGTSNSTDWYLLADPMEAEVIRMAFLNGREDPEIFVADDQRFGSLFTQDSIQLKIRHVYKAAAMDYAGIFGNDAAS